MTGQNMTPANPEFFFRLCRFAQDVMEACSGLKLSPVIYGSVAYLFHTHDSSVIIGDIDFLIPESTFAGISKAASQLEGVRVEATTYHSLKILSGDLKISFDAAEHYAPATYSSETLYLHGLTAAVLDKKSLVLCYTSGAATIPSKREAYLTKLQKLA
jgi:hypothetical protein